MSQLAPKKFEFFAKDKDGWMDIFEYTDNTITHIRIISDETFKNWRKEVTKTVVEDSEWKLFWEHVEPLELVDWKENYDIAEFDEVEEDGTISSLFVSHGFKWSLRLETATLQVHSVGTYAYPSLTDPRSSEVDNDGRFGDLCEAIEEILHYRFCHVHRIDRDHFEISDNLVDSSIR